MTTTRHGWIVLGAIGLMGSFEKTARADGDHERVSLTLNVPYLLVPVYELNAELAVRDTWSVALRGGVGESSFLDDERTIVELGGQGIYYVRGDAHRGVQLGIDTRFVRYEGDGMLAGLGDGVAVGPFVGYKRVFRSGVTLGGQVGAQVAAVGESDGRVLPYVALALGVSFWRAGDGATREAAEVVAPGDPLDHHRRAMVAVSVGLGTASIGGCDACELRPGLGVDASVGWFLWRRLALVVDSTAIVGASPDFGSFGFGLWSLAVQLWPREDIWIKVGVGAAQLTSLSAGATGTGVETGGGGTLAVGYEVHQNRNFGMDLQLRATHGSFRPEDDDFDGVDAYVGVLGFHWY